MQLDRVECAISVDAPVERVWAVMTEARHLARWYAFGGAEIDLSPFGKLVFRWREHGAYHGLLATIEPPYALSFLFSCLAPDKPVRLGNSTLVEFTAEPTGRATRVRVIESGFSRLDAPDQLKAELATSSRQAWTDGLGLLRPIAEAIGTDAAASLSTPAAAGRWMFAAGMAGFGAQFLLHAVTERVGAPGGPWIALPPLEAALAGTALIAGAAGVAVRWKSRWAALLLALVLIRVVLVHLAHLIANPRSPGPWTAGFELVGLFCVALVLVDDGASGRLTAVARFIFGVSLAVFGVQHFLYTRFVAAFMPAWIPVRPFWARAAGVSFFSAALCFVAASVSPLARRIAPLAATLLGVMYLLFVLSVHLFRIAAAPHVAQEWTSGMVALSWCGGSWILAGAFRGKESV